MTLSGKTISLVFFNSINTGTQFCLYIILSRFYSTTDYASFRQTFLPFETAAPLLGLGLTSSIFYFYPRFNEKNKLLIQLLLLIFLSSLVFCLSLFLGLNHALANAFNNAVLSKTLFYAGAFSFFSLSNAVLYLYYILSERYTFIVTWNFVCNSLFLLLIFLFSSQHYNIQRLIELRVVTYMVLFAGMLIPSKINFPVVKSFFSFLDLKTIFQYSFPVSVSATIGIVAYQLDNFIVGSFCTTNQYAVYTNGAMEIPFIAIITSSIATASFASMALLCKDLKFKEALRLFKKSSSASAFIIFPLFIFCMVYAKHIMVFIFGDKYADSAYIFQAYLLLLPLRIIYYGNALTALGKTKVLLFRSIVELIINAVSCILLFKIFSFNGIAFANVISVGAWTVPYNLIIISKGFQTNILKVLPLKKLLTIMLCCLLSISVCYFINTSLNNFVTLPLAYLISGGLLFFALYFIAAYFFGLYRFDNKAPLKFTLL